MECGSCGDQERVNRQTRAMMVLDRDGPRRIPSDFGVADGVVEELAVVADAFAVESEESIV